MLVNVFSKSLPIAAIGLALSGCAQLPQPTAAAPLPPGEGVGLERAADDFVQAFTTLDQVRFDKAWTADATLFFPMPVPGSGGVRFTGKDNVLSVFHRFFASVRKGRSGPDYLNIKPEDVHVQDYGDTAIVTFHLTGDQGVARRTLVMRREVGAWRVAHMHASNMSLPTAAAQSPSSQ